MDSFASASAQAGADPAQVAALRDEARRLRSAAREETLANLTHAFDQSLEQGHVLEPASDNARYYLAQLTQADAGSTATQLARGAYRARVLAEAGNALRAQDLAGTRRWLAEAREAGAGSAEVAALEAALSAAQDEAAQANTYVNESTLTRTRYVAPQFPAVARERGIDGWVDMQFLVGTDGAVSDVAVVGAQPVGMFEAACRHLHVGRFGGHNNGCCGLSCFDAASSPVYVPAGAAFARLARRDCSADDRIGGLSRQCAARPMGLLTAANQRLAPVTEYALTD